MGSSLLLAALTVGGRAPVSLGCLSIARDGNWLLSSFQCAGRDGPPQGTTGPHMWTAPCLQELSE